MSYVSSSEAYRAVAATDNHCVFGVKLEVQIDDLLPHPKNGFCHIRVRNLPTDASNHNEDLRNLFERYGSVTGKYFRARNKR